MKNTTNIPFLGFSSFYGVNDKTIWDYPPEERKKYLIALGIVLILILIGTGIYFAIQHWKEKRNRQRD